MTTADLHPCRVCGELSVVNPLNGCCSACTPVTRLPGLLGIDQGELVRTFRLCVRAELERAAALTPPASDAEIAKHIDKMARKVETALRRRKARSS